MVLAEERHELNREMDSFFSVEKLYYILRERVKERE